MSYKTKGTADGSVESDADNRGGEKYCENENADWVADNHGSHVINNQE